MNGPESQATDVLRSSLTMLVFCSEVRECFPMMESLHMGTGSFEA